MTAPILVHFDPSLFELVMAGDPSVYGIGMVISHRMSDGKERPITFASTTLSPVERIYAQVE